MAEELEDQDSFTPDEGTETQNQETADDFTSEEQTPEEKLQKLEELNKRLYARAKKAEERLKALEASSKQPQTEKVAQNDSFWRQKIEFLIRHKDFDEEHLDYLEAVAKGKGVSLEEAYKLPIVQKAIEGSLKEKKLAEALEGGKAKGETIKSLAEEAREVAKDPEKHKEFWKKMQSRPTGFQGE
jgi:hypothetical protein